MYTLPCEGHSCSKAGNGQTIFRRVLGILPARILRKQTYHHSHSLPSLKRQFCSLSSLAVLALRTRLDKSHSCCFLAPSDQIEPISVPPTCHPFLPSWLTSTTPPAVTRASVLNSTTTQSWTNIEKQMIATSAVIDLPLLEVIVMSLHAAALPMDEIDRTYQKHL